MLYTNSVEDLFQSLEKYQDAETTEEILESADSLAEVVEEFLREESSDSVDITERFDEYKKYKTGEDF